MYKTVGEVKHNGAIYPPGAEFPEGAATSEQILSLMRVGSLVEVAVTGSQTSSEPLPDPHRGEESLVATPLPIKRTWKEKKGGRR